MLASGFLRRVFRNSATAADCALPCRARRSRSVKRSSTKPLHPSRSPTKVTFGQTTGPRSSRIGESRSARLERNAPRALVGRTGAASGAAASTVNDRVDSGRRPPPGKPNRQWRGPFRRPTKPLLTSPAPEPAERLQVAGLGSLQDPRATSAAPAPRPALLVGPACPRLSPRPPAGHRACVAYRCSPENARPPQWPPVAR